MMNQRLWRPLLTGDQEQAASRAVRHIVENLHLLSRNSSGSDGYSSLAGGKAGEALFWSYLGHSTGDDAMAERAIDCLEKAAGTLATGTAVASLYGGFSGIGWTVEHLRRSLFEEDSGDPCQDIDEAVLRHLSQSPWTGDYDLIGGLVGFGVYAVERLPSPAARACLERIVEHLAERAVKQPGGLTWFTPARLLHSSQAPKYPNGYYNLGLAHGVPGAVAILAAACRAGVAVSTAESILGDAVSWLLSTRLDGGLFPALVALGETPQPSRLAWCYGNPGIAVALLAAARCVGHREWEEEALEIARSAARRPIETSGVRDAGFCHGTAGLAHLFNSIYQATGDETCEEAARIWFRRTLESMSPDDWAVGFPSWEVGADDELEWQEHAGLVTGVTGVGLALLAATTSIAPDWDRALLVSLP